MSDNSKSMTVEERLVQHMKGDPLMVVIQDEDALTDLARRAVEKALFEDRFVPGTKSWDSGQRAPSPAVAAAREIAEAATRKIVDEAVASLSANPKFVEAVQKALANSFDRYIAEAPGRFYADLTKHAVNVSAVEVRNLLMADPVFLKRGQI